jgi:8-oxo-dGTP pyrophosphatase MutT (NUDIX family)
MMTSNQAPKIHQASSLIVLNKDFEFLMLKRSSSTKFMPNFWVFPGGKLEAQDAQTWDLLSSEDQHLFASHIGLNDSKMHADAQMAKAKSHWMHLMAGIRETFEESGLLGSLEQAKVSQVDWLFQSVLKNAQFSDHWLTPENYPIRFDTLFFMYFLDEDAPIQIDQQEIVDGRWWKASEILEAYTRQDIEMGAPTIRLLVDLASFESAFAQEIKQEIKQVMLERRNRTLQRNMVICPKVYKDQDGTVLLFNEDQFFHAKDLKVADLMAQGSEIVKDRLVLRGKTLIPEINFK